ncbi:TPA: darobactin maturation radical SAM/SPASM protein DarE [Yersinia enterocolitica]|nr:darobactin maturation radical SAM/SPASM protein DarE [Yersinia enterocolitica]EKN3547675.1 darobactin maturation radical SAM/SPASM protein DarE [Yersinia enterocolitica]EKN3858959.1 darobactin maturation radical SAM/SPASM protein DarE [Yersinia enterocolitica]ELI8255467.1 darobactin maturation radical SAM/SPASM protein DarE [Yersinia enterocolitica]ELI8339680.1 darobactin maturation radical SAM/SPASM protein DarE [Yersinia enterocolitica]
MDNIIPVININSINIRDINIKKLEQLTTCEYKTLSAHLIGKIPSNQLLDEDELTIFNTELTTNILVNAIKADKLVIVLKATRLCNLRCTYCHSWAEGPNQTISFDTLIHAVHKILSIPNVNRFEFVWHGGEVTLLKPLFFKKLIWLQQQFKRPEQYITNTMQSNIVNLSDVWLTFIKGIGMNVGISLDGVPAVNDKRRVDYRGKGTSERIAKGIKKLQHYNILYGALIVVDREVYQTDMKEMLDYFISIELTGIEFLNIVPDNRLVAGEYVGNNFISYAEFIKFLSDLFIIWIKGYREKIHITIFEDFIKVLEHPDKKLSACYWSGNCSQEIITLEPNGDVSPCDKYRSDNNSIYGSILNTDLAELLANSSHNQQAINEEKTATEKMQHCEWFSICHGGCPHDRVINRRHTEGYNDTCCGTGKLLATIQRYLANTY